MLLVSLQSSFQFLLYIAQVLVIAVLLFSAYKKITEVF